MHEWVELTVEMYYAMIVIDYDLQNSEQSSPVKSRWKHSNTTK